MILKYSVGLDISGKDIKANFSSIDENQRVKVKSSKTVLNTNAGYRQLEAWVKRNRKDLDILLLIVMEATGVYHENCSFFFHKKDYQVCIVLPNKAKKYLAYLGLKSKNDKLDAKGLAQMGAEQALLVWQPADKFFYVLRALTRQQQNIQESKTAILNQIHAEQTGYHTNKTVVKHLNQILKLYLKQLKEIEKGIVQHLKTNEEVHQKVKNICLVKGLATLSVSVVVAETLGFTFFYNGKQLVSYAGYDSVENQSGKHFGKTRISKKGNSRIRRILHLPAFSVVRHKQTAFVNLFNRNLPKHNIKMKSYVAVQKKLLTTIFALWKNNTPYDNEYHKKTCTGTEMEFSSIVDFNEIVVQHA